MILFPLKIFDGSQWYGVKGISYDESDVAESNDGHHDDASLFLVIFLSISPDNSKFLIFLIFFNIVKVMKIFIFPKHYTPFLFI